MEQGGNWRRSLVARWSALAGALVSLGVGCALLLSWLLPGDVWLVAGITLTLMLPLVVLVVRQQLQAMLSLFHALAGTVASYRDGDFSFGLHWPRNDELRDLVAAHNALGDVLREQRLDLVQRELLLDTMCRTRRWPCCWWWTAARWCMPTLPRASC